MKIAIIGRGNIGRTLAQKWAAAGHDITFGVRDPADDGTASILDAVTAAEVVLLAIPGAPAKDVVRGLGEALSGKVVIDATNEVGSSEKLHALDELTTGALPSGHSTRSAGRTLPTRSLPEHALTSFTRPRKAERGRSRSS